jgi:hypothetical protein
MGERTRYDPGTFCWVGLATSDPARARAFYTSLFGWQGRGCVGGRGRNVHVAAPHSPPSRARPTPRAASKEGPAQ